jgi:hypothetical protein
VIRVARVEMTKWLMRRMIEGIGYEGLVLIVQSMSHQQERKWSRPAIKFAVLNRPVKDKS